MTCEQTKISVVIPVYNYENGISELWESLKQQTFDKNNLEFIFIDNKSSDNTRSLLDGIRDRESANGYRIAVLSESKIQSSYAARNKGIQATTGDVIVFTDADCRPMPDWIEEMHNFFTTNTNANLVAGKIVASHGASLFEKYAERKKFLSQEFTLHHKFLPYGQTANLAVKKSVFKKIGLFRPHLSTGGDADICWRYIESFHSSVHYNVKSIVMHKHRQDMNSLFAQWYKYGCSRRYLEELWKLEKMRTNTTFHFFVKLIRRLPFELIKNLIFKKEMNLLNTLEHPLDIYTSYASNRGYLDSLLKEEMKEITAFEDS